MNLFNQIKCLYQTGNRAVAALFELDIKISMAIILLTVIIWYLNKCDDIWDEVKKYLIIGAVGLVISIILLYVGNGVSPFTICQL